MCGVGAQNAFDYLELAVRAHTLLAHDRANTEGRCRGGKQGISLAIDRNQSKENKGKRKETLTAQRTTLRATRLCYHLPEVLLFIHIPRDLEEKSRRVLAVEL